MVGVTLQKTTLGAQFVLILCGFLGYFNNNMGLGTIPYGTIVCGSVKSKSFGVSENLYAIVYTLRGTVGKTCGASAFVILLIFLAND